MGLKPEPVPYGGGWYLILDVPIGENGWPVLPPLTSDVDPQTIAKWRAGCRAAAAMQAAVFAYQSEHNLTVRFTL